MVVPEMREALNISPDIPENIYDVKKEFEELMPNIDFSEFDKIEDKLHHYILNIDTKLKEKMYDKIEQTTNPISSNAFEVLMDCIRPTHPAPFESKWNLFNRWDNVKKFVKDYIEKNSVSKEQKVILWGHFWFFMYYTGKWDKEYLRDEILPNPDNYIILKNWEFKADPTNYESIA